MNLTEPRNNVQASAFPKLTDLASGVTALLKDFINQQNLALLLEDEHRQIVFANDAFTNLFSPDISPEALLGCDCTNAAAEARILFQNPEVFDRFIEDTLANDASASAELKLKNGFVLKASYRRVEVPSGAQGHLWIYDPKEF